jgi:lipopolysaccharide export system permease protein
MIILRYLSKELLQSTFAVTFVLMIVIMSGRFVKYLAQAARGEFDTAVLFSIMFYRLPGFVELILPLGFMVGILMAYGRLYSDQEMTVLSSCGMSQKRLLTYTYIIGFVIALITGMCSLWLSPLGLQKAEAIIQQQKNRNEFETMKAKSFQISRTGKTVTYTEEQSRDGVLEEVFVSTMNVAANEDIVTLRAKSAVKRQLESYQKDYLQFNEGVRFEGRPGENGYRVTQFKEYGVVTKEPEVLELSNRKVDMLSTPSLLQQNSIEAKSTLQWRFSSPMLIIAVTLLGVAMSYTTPRRGRYAMLFPAIVLYLIYLMVLNAARDAVNNQSLSLLPGLWLVHIVFLLLFIFIYLSRMGILERYLNRNKIKVDDL